MKAKFRGVEFEINSKEDAQLVIAACKDQDFQEVSAGSIIKALSIKQVDKTALIMPVSKGVKARANKWWTKEEEEYLNSNKDVLSPGAMGKVLGRKSDAVRQRIKILNKKGVSALPAGAKHSTNPADIGRGSYKSVRPKVVKMILDGVKTDKISKKCGVPVRYIYDLRFALKRSAKKVAVPVNSQDKSMDNAKFYNLEDMDQDTLKELIKASSKNRAKITARDLVALLSITEKEVKPVMIDVFNQQSKLGYKVKIVDNELVFY